MRVERLTNTHDRSAFASGVEALDAWFRHHALVAQRLDTARTFVLVDDWDRVVGYYNFTMGSLERADSPRRLVRGLPRFPVPIVLLARLGINQSAQRNGLGLSLLYEALCRAILAAEQAAVRLIAVDPIDGGGLLFYREWGFTPVQGDLGGRLFIRTSDALASFPNNYGI